MRFYATRLSGINVFRAEVEMTERDTQPLRGATGQDVTQQTATAGQQQTAYGIMRASANLLRRNRSSSYRHPLLGEGEGEGEDAVTRRSERTVATAAGRLRSANSIVLQRTSPLCAPPGSNKVHRLCRPLPIMPCSQSYSSSQNHVQHPLTTLPMFLHYKRTRFWDVTPCSLIQVH